MNVRKGLVIDRILVGVRAMLPHRRGGWPALAVSAVAVIGLVVGSSAGAAEALRISGNIQAGSDGDCTYSPLQGPVLRWQCVGAGETYTGSLDGPALYTVNGAYNLASGATVVSGSETFYGCVDGAGCGTLEWSFRASFSTDPVTVELLRGRGQAHITGGTGDLAGAKGSFTFRCDANGQCTYEGSIVR